METRDIIDLGLIALASLTFYYNGFYVGVYRCKRMFEQLSDDDPADTGPDIDAGRHDRAIRPSSRIQRISRKRGLNGDRSGDHGAN